MIYRYKSVDFNLVCDINSQRVACEFEKFASYFDKKCFIRDI